MLTSNMHLASGYPLEYDSKLFRPYMDKLFDLHHIIMSRMI
jgi:hypothetical protein